MLHPRRRTNRFAVRAIGSASAAVAVACGACASAGAPGSMLRVAVAPVGTDTITGVEWMRVAVPGGGALSAAVARPVGVGPHPVLVILHGTHGFAREYVGLARDLAREAGVIAIAACWFAGRRGAGVERVTPIECPEAPPIPSTGMTPEALVVVDALVGAARALPGVRPDRVALLGHSRGAVAAVHYAIERGSAGRGAREGLHAVVLNSGAYPPELVARAAALSIPALLLHGTADGPAEGGSEMTTVARARAFEAALLAARKVVKGEYFDDARHSALFYNADQRARSLRHIADFLRWEGLR